MKRHIEKDAKEQVIDRIALFFERSFPQIQTAYIHGSFVMEETFSDIDIGILVDSPVADVLALEFEIENELQQCLGMPVDVRLLNASPLSFQYNVIQRKRLVLDRKPNHRAEFESRTLRKYFDFAPFQKRYLREVLNAPV